jgi:hypothetical protein
MRRKGKHETAKSSSSQSASTHVKETEMRRIASVLIASAALVAALGSPAIADDHRVLGLIPVKADNAYLLNNTHVLENANVELLNQR